MSFVFKNVKLGKEQLSEEQRRIDVCAFLLAKCRCEVKIDIAAGTGDF